MKNELTAGEVRQLVLAANHGAGCNDDGWFGEQADRKLLEGLADRLERFTDLDLHWIRSARPNVLSVSHPDPTFSYEVIQDHTTDLYGVIETSGPEATRRRIPGRWKKMAHAKRAAAVAYSEQTWDPGKLVATLADSEDQSLQEFVTWANQKFSANYPALADEDLRLLHAAWAISAEGRWIIDFAMSLRGSMFVHEADQVAQRMTKVLEAVLIGFHALGLRPGPWLEAHLNDRPISKGGDSMNHDPEEQKQEAPAEEAPAEETPTEEETSDSGTVEGE